MTTQRIYLSTTIPYVNSRAHVGHALELVQADVLARHHRRIGNEVRLQSGTDDNSLKNVLAAQAEGISTRALVNRNAGAFAALSLGLLAFGAKADPIHIGIAQWGRHPQLDAVNTNDRLPRPSPGVPTK